MKTNLLAAGGVALFATVAIAATSLNFINDPEVFDGGGGFASSTNFDTHGSIDGTSLSADIGGGNQSGSASSTNFINVIGFPEAASPGAAGGPPSVVVAAGASNPGATNELNTTTASIPMLQFVVTAGTGGDVFITDFVIDGSGTGDEFTDVTGVDLYADSNGNGLVDGGEATVAAQQSFTVNDGSVTFSPATAIQLSAGSSATYLVVYTFAGSASATETFTATIGLGGLVAEDVAAAPLTPSGLPQAGGTKTMVAGGSTGSVTLTVGAANPGGTQIGGAGSGIPWFQFTLAASTVEAVTVNSITFTATGTLNDILDIAAVDLFVDLNGNGVVDGGETALTASQTYTGDNGTVTFTGINHVIGAGASSDFLVTYDIAGTAMPGDTGAISIANNTDVGSTGNTSTNATPTTGAPAGSVRFLGVAGPSTTTVGGGGGGGGGCAMLPAGSAPAAPSAPWAVWLPWLALCAALAWRRRP